MGHQTLKDAACVKIYCDTDTLDNNMRRHENAPKVIEELKALTALRELEKSGKLVMYKSRHLRAEADATSTAEQRRKLQDDYQALHQIPIDENPIGSFNFFDPRTCIANPIVSDTLDESIRNELMERGISERDAQHITHAVKNSCDVFLTRDEQTIIKPYGEWLEARFSPLKIRRPSELLAELSEDADRPRHVP